MVARMLPCSNEGRRNVDLGVTLINTFVVLAVGVVLTYLTNDRFRALRSEFRGEFRALRDEIGEVKADVARVEARLDAGIAAVRSDIVQVALAVGVKRSEAQG
jgi:hypothetical protein